MKKPLEAEGWTSSPMWLAQPSRSARVGSVKRRSDRTLHSHLRQHPTFITCSVVDNPRQPCSEAERYVWRGLCSLPWHSCGTQTFLGQT